MLIVVGGHSRSVGKTSVVAGLIAGLREFGWVAAKITQYGHGICSNNGSPCDCATADHAWAVTQETSRAGKSDTSRFLAAGAERVYWVRTEQGRLAEAMPAVREKIVGAANIILESNSILKFLRPDLYLVVLDSAKEDFKSSAREFMDRADAVIVHQPAGRNAEGTAWKGVSLKPVSGRPVFPIQPPEYVTPELLEFVKSRLTG